MQNNTDTQPQQHPISLYFKVWGLLFVLSSFSYLVDYMQYQGLLRWTLILVFMFLKAGLIVAVFMHMDMKPQVLFKRRLFNLCGMEET